MIHFYLAMRMLTNLNTTICIGSIVGAVFWLGVSTDLNTTICIGSILYNI